MNENFDGIKYAIGFDIGDGESSIAYVKLESEGDPEVFITAEGEKSIPTAVASTDRGYVIGTEALFEEGYRLEVNFKSRPTHDKNKWRLYRSLLPPFAEIFYAQFVTALKEKKNIDLNPEEVRVYVGHPASWNREDREQYQKIFAHSVEALPSIEIRPESSAAFIYVHDQYRNEETKFTREQADPALVIDIGSSTTDFTYLRNLKPEELHFGDNFGARLIDEVIFNQIITTYEEAEILKTRSRADEQYLRYLCRKVKESYFSDSLETPAPQRPSFKFITETFWPLLKEVDIEEILETPLPGFDAGWRDTYRQLLLNVRKAIHPNYPRLVIITGGGSRMPFTREICRKVFSEAAVEPDRTTRNFNHDPSLSVAIGLAGYGRWRYLVSKFNSEIVKLVESDEVEQEIRRYMPDYFKELFDHIYQGTVFKSLMEAIYSDEAIDEFYESELDSAQELDDIMDKYLQRWSKAPQTVAFLRQANNNLAKRLEPIIGKKANKVAVENRLDENALTFDLNLFSMSFFQNEAGGAALEALSRVVNDNMHQIVRLNRKIYPKKAFKAIMKAAVWSAYLMAPVAKIVVKPGRELKEKFVQAVREQIRKQLLARAATIEELIGSNAPK